MATLVQAGRHTHEHRQHAAPRERSEQDQQAAHRTVVPGPGLGMRYAIHAHNRNFESWDLKFGELLQKHFLLEPIKAPAIILSISMLLVGIFTMNKCWQTRRC